MSRVIKLFASFFLLAFAACAGIPPSPTVTLQPTSLPQPTTAYPTAAFAPTRSPTTTLTPALLSTSTPQPSGPSIADLRLFDQAGWALQVSYAAPNASTGSIFHTIDGAQTWQDVTPPIPDGYRKIPKTSFVDADTALAVYSKSLLPKTAQTQIVILRTVDGGRTWQAAEPLLLDQAPLISIHQISMMDRSQGWMLGAGSGSMGRSSVTLYTTRDGGLHWSVVYNTIDHGPAYDQNTLWVNANYPYTERAMTFISPQTGFYSSGNLFNTRDGGKTWTLQYLPSPQNWAELTAPFTQNDLFSAILLPYFTSSQDGVLIRRVYPRSQVTLPPGTYHGIPLAQILYSTHDGGQSWTTQPTPAKIGEPHFLNASRGLFLGKDDADPAKLTQLYRTTDGGKTWVQISAACPLPLGSLIQWADADHASAFTPTWAGAVYGEFDPRSNSSSSFFITGDGGVTWQEVKIP